MILFEHQLMVTKDLSIVRWQKMVEAVELLIESFGESEQFSHPLKFTLSPDGLSTRFFRAGRTSILKLAVNRRDYAFRQGLDHIPIQSLSFEEDFMIRCLLLAWVWSVNEREGSIRVDGSQSGWQMAADYVSRVAGLAIDLNTDERFTFNNQDRSTASTQDRKMFDDLLAGELLVAWKREHSISWFF